MSASNPTPRRIVLIAVGGGVERVMSEPSAADAIKELRLQAALHSGQTVAAEWLSDLGWIRWITKESWQ